MLPKLNEHMELVTWRLLLTECKIWKENAFFSRPGNFNSVWQLLHFQDNPVTVSGYRQGWGSGTEGKNLVAC